MEHDLATLVGKALFSKLSAFHRVNDKVLRAVLQVEEEGCLVQLVLDFGRLCLVAIAISDDDSIEFRTEKSADVQETPYTDISRTEFWKDFVGLKFGWGWVTFNQQGYCDGLLLSFEGIDPQVLLNVVASSIKLRRIHGPAI